MAYSFVICTSTGAPLGEPLAAKKRSITRTLNSPTTATIALQLGDPLATYLLPTAEPRLKVYRSPSPAEIAANPGATRTLLFYGLLPRPGFHADAPSDTVSCTFQDPTWRLSRLYAIGTEVYAATDQGLILWNLIAAQNALMDTWIRQGATTTGTKRDRSFSRTLLSQLFSDMTKLIDGCDFDFAPVDGHENGDRTMGVLDVYKQQGTDLPNAVFGYSPDGISNVAGATLDYLDLTTVAQVTGVAADGTPVVGNAGTPNVNGPGRLEQVTADQDVSVQSTVNAKAGGIIAEQGSERPVVAITGPLPDAPQAFVDYDIGDTVRVAIKRGAFQQISSPRVMGFTVDIDNNGALNTSLVLANPPGVYVAPPDAPGLPSQPGVPDAGTATITTPHTMKVGSSAAWVYGAGYYKFTSPGKRFVGVIGNTGGGDPNYISQKTILGLTVGHTYTVSAWVRGPDMIINGGVQFAIFVGGGGGISGITHSADDSAHIWNADPATRKGFTQLSVVFTATQVSEFCGWYFRSDDVAGFHGFSTEFATYTSDWTVTA